MEYVVIKLLLSKELRRLRREAQLSQREVERRAQLPTGTVSKVESNQYKRTHVWRFIRYAQVVDFFRQHRHTTLLVEPYSGKEDDKTVYSVIDFLRTYRVAEQTVLELMEEHQDPPVYTKDTDAHRLAIEIKSYLDTIVSNTDISPNERWMYMQTIHECVKENYTSYSVDRMLEEAEQEDDEI